MTVDKMGEIFRCNICGNLAVVKEVGGGTLVCCGQGMEKTGEMAEAYCNKLLKEKEIVAAGDWKALVLDYGYPFPWV